MKRFLTAVILSMTLFLFSIPALAADDYAGTTYTVRIYAGAQGTISGSSVAEYSGLSYGDRVTFSLGSVQVAENSKYYPRGIRESGKDNYPSVEALSFEVTQDIDYVVAYGIKGDNMTTYTVNYVATDGTVLSEPETYIGNVGDKPVVAYLYFENYRPQFYNLTGTLSANAADNVFTFQYVSTQAEEPTPTPAPPTPVPTQAPTGGGETTGGETAGGGTAAGGEGTAAGGEGTAAGGEGAAAAGETAATEGTEAGTEGTAAETENPEAITEETTPASPVNPEFNPEDETEELGDTDIPLAGGDSAGSTDSSAGDTEEVEETKGPAGGLSTGAIAGIAVAAIAVLALIIALVSSRRKKLAQGADLNAGDNQENKPDNK